LVPNPGKPRPKVEARRHSVYSLEQFGTAMAQTPVQHYLPKLMERIERGDIDPSFVITHRASLEQGPELYKTFRAKEDGCIKVVMKP
jgi:threonine dehydrogenase-like Zn-dependent dehydrogenase